MGIFNLFYQFDRCTSNPNAEVVVLIHGLGLNAHTWRPLVLMLVERYHVLRYDLRGHGKSLNDGSELTWELLCNDLDDLYHECGIEKAHMIGHGFGGSLTVKYELTRPDRVETVVLISTVGFYPPGLVKRSLSLRQGYAGNGGAAELGEQMTRLVTCLSLDSEEAGWINEAYRQCDMKVYFHLALLFTATSPLDDLSAITKPCMVIGGEKDTLYPSYMSDITATFIPTARSVTVLNAASMVHVDNPIYTARKIMDFYANPLSGRETVHAGNPQLGIMNSDIVELLSQVSTEIPSIAAPRIEVRLIGIFRVCINGREISNGWQQRSAKRLLVYLLFHPYAARTQICEALWPQAEASKASNQLRVSLSHLKALFEADGVSPILSDRSHVQLQGEIDCDIIAWMLLLEEARNENDEETKIRLIKEVLSYTVEGLLPGLYDDWALQERSRLEYLLLELAQLLTDSYRRNGEYLAANQLARRFEHMFGEVLLTNNENNGLPQRGVDHH